MKKCYSLPARAGAVATPIDHTRKKGEFEKMRILESLLLVKP